MENEERGVSMEKDLSNEQVIHVKESDGIEYLQFRRLLEYKEITHCFTMKGKENINYISALKNLYFPKLCNHLGIDREKLAQIEMQVHGDVVKEVEDYKEIYTDMDGLITNQKGVTLGLRFADCTPIFFYDPVKKVVGNIHSGWRGTVKKIGKRGIEQMQKIYGSSPKDILCCIGPCIKECHFEVEEDAKTLFEEAFAKESNVWKECIQMAGIKEGKQKYKINTTKLIIEMLEQAGVKPENIVDSGICTVCHADQIHSHRAEKEKAGRNMGLIALRGGVKC